VIWTNLILIFAAFFLAGGEEIPPVLTAKEHPWGHFEPGSHCTIQTVITTNVGSQTSKFYRATKAELISVDKNGVHLQETETAETGNKLPGKERQTMRDTDFYQETVQKETQVRQGPLSKLMIGRKVVPCLTRIYETKTADGDLSVTIWYSPQVCPYVLRTERVLRSAAADKPVVYQCVAAVQETSALKSKFGRNDKTYSIQITEKTAGNITKITEERGSWDIPGGILYSVTREFNEKNEEIRVTVSRTATYRGRWK
jgi:hypothetical protein